MANDERWEPDYEAAWNSIDDLGVADWDWTPTDVRKELTAFGEAIHDQERAHYEPIVAKLRARVTELEAKLRHAEARCDNLESENESLNTDHENALTRANEAEWKVRDLESQLAERAPQLVSSAMSQAGDCDVICSVCGAITDEPHAASECFAIAQADDQYSEDSKSEMISDLEAEVQELNAKLARGVFMRELSDDDKAVLWKKNGVTLNANSWVDACIAAATKLPDGAHSWTGPSEVVELNGKRCLVLPEAQCDAQVGKGAARVVFIPEAKP